MSESTQDLPALFEPPPEVPSEPALGPADPTESGTALFDPVNSTAAKRLTVDEVLEQMGRRGGPSEFGWHAGEARFLCPRKAYYDEKAGGLGHGNSESTALGVGSTLHEFLADRYATRLENRTYVDTAVKVEKTVELLNANGHEAVADEAQRLYVGYSVKYDREDEFVEKCKVIAVEKLFHRELPWGQRYSGRADLVLEAKDGIVIVDHKTARARDAEFNEGWVLDPAQIGLQWLVAHEYKHVSGYYINGIIKTVRLDTSKDFPRIFFAASQRIIRDWLDMMRYRHVESQNAKIAGYPANFANCLVRRGDGFRRCQWFNACALGLRPSAKLLPSLL